MSSKISIKCEKHKNKNIEYIQINGVLDQEVSKQLFYCSKCIFNYNNFKQSDFIDIDQLLESGELEVIEKWPPVNNQDIIQNLKTISQGQHTFHYANQIKEYFLQLKNEINSQLDNIQQKVIDNINVYPSERQIILKYQSISEIHNLINLIESFKQEDLQKNQLDYRDFIEKMEKNKEKNSSALQQLSQKINILKSNIDFQMPNYFKEQILFLINQINFFQHPIDRFGFPLRSKHVAQIDPVKQIMDLVSNKSNFCSQRFLNQLEKDLSKFSLLFNKDTFQDIHSQYKINFNQLNEQDLTQIKQYVNHKNRLNSKCDGSKYANTILQQEHLQQIINTINQSNFNQEEIKQIKQTLIDTAPFYNKKSLNIQASLKNVIQQSTLYQFFQELGLNETVNSFCYLSKLSLFDFAPEKIQLKDIFIKAENIIKEKEYLNSEIFENMNNIPQSIQNCFNNADSEQTIARNVMNLYSLDSIEHPVYKFLNNTLFSLDNKLVSILQKFYLIFCISLFIYCDKDVTQISSSMPLRLYRGINIKNQDFDDIIKENNIISLPGFSSFSSEKRTAQHFTKISKFSDTIPVIFKCSYEANTKNYSKRPKNISKVAQFNEDEYIFQPFSRFQIISTKEKDDYYLVKIKYIQN
ncbi:hypothetical protein ABPG72_006447 [Tetrahymena utriculariae]